jgi:ferric-dicitrate binding protein FerR (iron transport regulator)
MRTTRPAPRAGLEVLRPTPIRVGSTQRCDHPVTWGEEDRPVTIADSPEQPPRRRRELAAWALLAFLLAAIGFLVWWLSMADASMTGCGGG